MGSATMKSPQFVKQLIYIRRFNQGMIMIGQNAPSERLIGVKTEYSEQIAGKTFHPFRIFANQMSVLKARG